MTKYWQAAFFLLALTAATQCVAEVTVERSERRAVVRVDGELFAEYLTRSGHQPAVWPIIGPTGQPMTRSYPIGPLLDTETDDHPHHHSLWFAHEDVNGHDFWVEPKEGTPQDETNVIKHVDFVKLEHEGNQAEVVTHNQWLAGKDNVVCEDERTLIFGADAESRWIDFTIKITATNGPVTIGDIKDGTFSVRVAGPLKVDSGGTLVNSVGQKNADAWGMPAEWIDNYGPLDGKTVGVAMFSHPSNFQHPCRWHVRNYGLLCANPFGDRQFPPSTIKQHGVTIRKGESLELRYLVLLHRGDTKAGRVAATYQKYAGPVSKKPSEAVLSEDFESGMDRWEATDADQPKSVWSIVTKEKGGKPNHYLRVSGMSKYEPPVRSPHSIVWLKDHKFGSFDLTAKVQNTNPTAGPHRDLCFFWGRQDASHFYYVHLGAKPDPHSSQIFIVNGADRKLITSNKSPGIPWTDGWHQVKVRHDSETGLMQVYFDDMQNPVLTATDTTFSSGQIGLGTFDDSGNFDDIELRGDLLP